MTTTAMEATSAATVKATSETATAAAAETATAGKGAVTTVKPVVTIAEVTATTEAEAESYAMRSCFIEAGTSFHQSGILA